MFESLKKNIQSVQDGITAGLQRLSVGEKSATTPTESNVNLAAGEDLLQMYQTQWATMHHMAEQNAKLAQDIDSAITTLTHECENQHGQMAEIHSLLAHLPNIMAQLHSMLATIGSLRGLFEEVEGGLLALEDLEEDLALQEKTLDLRLSLALSREKHNHRLNALRNELSVTHQAKMVALEQHQETQRKEREQVFSEQFTEDLKNYKERGVVTRRISSSEDEQGLKLEEVDLEQDTSELDQFLNDPA
ncbi:dysbindin protein homolog [Penaeus vannamei]|uniref:Putative dysbindin protein-like n=1 Tax=Penaeus vannamei TaxID=6689 RepID=A0A3R7SZH1_PENVA|nr:dysbindin protein homolog [Penaeus vannamei]ROT83008.1 putative dysbindin protein-like [Penaeus vannamei]